MNTKHDDALQYQQLKEQVASYCVSTLGRDKINQLTPSSNLQVVQVRLQETTESRKILESKQYVPFMGLKNIESIFHKLEKGITLEVPELTEVEDFTRSCRKIKQFMEQNKFQAPLLEAYSRSLYTFKELEDELEQMIANGKIVNQATRELARLRRQISEKESSIQERLDKFIKNKSNREMLQEYYVTKKQGRYTVPVKASYKNQVNGTLVENSGRGTTVFVEPASVRKLSAELEVLMMEEAVEVYQIIAMLSGMILERMNEMKQNMDLIGQYDMIFARGKHSYYHHGNEPKINQEQIVQIKNARHPLLTGEREQVVPLQLEIGADFRTLMITGPNAGGKTVVLKTVGLLTLAVMSGFHIDADPTSQIAIFDHIFVDIGDNQSLENALSTFSSHMQNISDIFNAATRNTLLLFDEIGSGTDPREGAALAIAILEAFYQKGCLTIATTHYGEIKDYAELHEDFTNAAMLFESNSLTPKYQLQIGASGESQALWIAQKMQLPKEVLERGKLYQTDHQQYRLAKINFKQKKKATKTIFDEVKEQVSYQKGDRVLLTEKQLHGLVYEAKPLERTVVVYLDGKYVTVPVRRVQLAMPATELYPAGYDLEQLFGTYQERKRKRDMERGSKKMAKKIRKEQGKTQN